MNAHLAYVLATATLCLASNAQTWTEVGDAGQSIGSHQITNGIGLLTTIDGAIASGDIDLYRITVTDVSSFSASTVGTASFDTVLYLFDMAGNGIVRNDDEGGIQSMLSNALVPSHGDYLLGISNYGQTPRDASGSDIFSLSPSIGQNPPNAGAGELDHWDTPFPPTGTYSIVLTGVGYWQATASLETIGSGCGAGDASIYQRFTNGAADLDGTVLRGTPTAAGHTWTTFAGSTQAIGTVGPPTQLVLTDDDKQSPGSLGLTVTSNGVVAFDPSITVTWNSTWAEASAAPKAVYCWSDLNPTIPGSGQVFYEESGDVAQITYDGVFTYNTTEANRFQMLIDVQSGFMEIRIDQVAAQHAPLLVGYAPDGPNANPGQTDLSAITVPVPTIASEGQVLGLQSVGGPVFVNTYNVIQATTTDIPPSAFVHIGVIGTSNPNVPLSLIGLSSGCNLHASLDSYAVTVFGTTPPADYTWDIATVPPNLALAGFQLNAQAFVFDFSGTFDASDLASNGLEYHFGY